MNRVTFSTAAIFYAARMRSIPASDSALERRHQPRYRATDLRAQLRLKGHFGRVGNSVVDFNRFGLAIRLQQPLPKQQIVYLSLEIGEMVIERVIGVVHNCLADPEGYRCGILFRTASDMQFDREMVESDLEQLEQLILANKAGQPLA